MKYFCLEKKTKNASYPVSNVNPNDRSMVSGSEEKFSVENQMDRLMCISISLECDATLSDATSAAALDPQLCSVF